MQAAGLVLHLCGEGPRPELPTLGMRVGTYTNTDGNWDRPNELGPIAEILRGPSVSLGTEDFFDQGIEHFDPSHVATAEEKYCEIYKPDLSNIVYWSEEDDLVSTLSHRDKTQILDVLGDAVEVHGESYPTLPPVDENAELTDEQLAAGLESPPGPRRRRRLQEAEDDLDTITDQRARQAEDEVAGQEDTHEAEEANEEPDEDDSDGEAPTPAYEPSSQQKKDLQIAHENSGHPSAKDFAKMLRRGNAKPEIANWVAKHFRCPECEANT